MLELTSNIKTITFDKEGCGCNRVKNVQSKEKFTFLDALEKVLVETVGFGVSQQHVIADFIDVSARTSFT